MSDGTGSGLRAASTRAVLWSAMDAGGRQVLAFGAAIALARLVAPVEHGKILLLYLVMGIASVFVDGGLSAALVQRQDAGRAEASSVFWFNLGMGALMAALISAGAPWLAAFFEEPAVQPLAYVVAATVFVNALGTIHLTLLAKQLRFRTTAFVGTVSTAVAAVVGIALALRGYGVWALAAQLLAASVTSTALLWWWNPWRPALVFDWRASKQLFVFGSHMFAAALLEIAYNRLSSVVIGKFHGKTELAFYNRADNTKQQPVDLVANTVVRAALPIFAKASHDRERLRRGTRIALGGTMLINAPLMLGLLAVADNAVLTLFGGEWAGATPYLRVLCLAGLLWPFHVINLQVLAAQGHSGLFFRLELIKKVFGFAVLAAGAWLAGVLGIAVSQVVYGVFALFVNCHYTGTLIGHGAAAQLRDAAPPLLAAAVMALAVGFTGIGLDLPVALELLVQVAVGAVVYVVLCLALRLAAFRETLALLRLARGRSAEGLP